MSTARTFRFAAIALAAFLAPSFAWGQTGYAVAPRPIVVTNPAFAARPFVGAGAFRASTVAESRLRGIATLRAATASAQLRRAQAAVVYEQARSAYLDNRAKYLRQRQQQRSRYAALLSQRTAEAAMRNALRKARREEERLRRQDEQVLLADHEWPAALRTPHYDSHRAEVAGLIELRARLGDASPATDAALKAALRNLAKRVVADAESDAMTAEEFRVAKSFVRGLPKRALEPSLTRDEGTMLAMSDR